MRRGSGATSHDVAAANGGWPVVKRTPRQSGVRGGRPGQSGQLAEAIARDFGSLERWHTEFAAMGKAQGGGSG